MLIVRIVGGLLLLIGGAELLVRGASRLARAVGLTHLVIGLTVVAFGTSAPEFAVSVKAGLAGQADIALGNVVGSNIFNVLFILGVSALVAPLVVSKQLVRLDVPVMISASIVAWLCALDGGVDRLEGGAMAAGLVLYTGVLIWFGQKQEAGAAEVENAMPARRRSGLLPAAVMVIAGLALLVAGARWFVDGSADLARWLGVSELMIGLTIVAAGTSLPELATSVVASIRGERDIAVGNIVGSNIFNILAVLGVSAFVSGKVEVSSSALRFDIPVMTATAVACLPIFFTGGRISRWEGALFVGYYLAYVAWLVLASSQHKGLPAFSSAMLWFALPGTALGLALSAVYSLRQRTRQRDNGPA